MKTLLSDSTMIAVVLLAGCGASGRSILTPDQLLVQADSTLSVVENTVTDGLHSAYNYSDRVCQRSWHNEGAYQLCVQGIILPWYSALKAVAAAQDALLVTYQVRMSGGDVLGSLACARTTLVGLNQQLKGINVAPSSEFVTFVLDVLKNANGRACVGG